MKIVISTCIAAAFISISSAPTAHAETVSYDTPCVVDLAVEAMDCAATKGKRDESWESCKVAYAVSLPHCAE